MPNHFNLEVVEVNFGNQVHRGTRPVRTVHKHVGYVLYKEKNRMSISPELTINSRGVLTRVDHALKINRGSVPRPVIRSLTELVPTERVLESDIIEVGYEDPTSRNGFFTQEDIASLGFSIFWFVGYLAEETETALKLGVAKFEYNSDEVDYETIHIIPKKAIVNTRRFRVKSD